MREMFQKFGSASVRLAAFAIAAAVAVPAHAQRQPPEFLDLDITVTYEYPAEIRNGDTFPVYAWISNNSDQTIEAPLPSYVLMRSDADLIYSSDFCRLHCLFARTRLIEPGGKVLLHMGDVYTHRPGLTETQVGYGDMKLAGYTADGQLYAVDVEDIHPIVIKPADLPGAPYVPFQPAAMQLMEQQNIVRDPNTGYEWLRFDATVGISPEALQNRLQPGGEWHGFHVANRYQVQTLIRNQLLSANTNLSRSQLSGPMGVEGLTALQQLVGFLQPTGETETKNFVKGIVVDPVPLVDNNPHYVSLTLYGAKNLDTLYFSSPYGLETQVIDGSTLAADAAETGVWLVRGAPVDAHQTSGKAAYADDYLFLPNVLIDGNHYRAELFRKEGTEPSFFMTNLSAASAADLSQPVATFNAGTSSLMANDVRIMSDYPAGQYDLVLQIVPETDPPLVKLVNLSPGQD